MNIVLIGYRGAGKSVVGRLLAGRVGMEYVGMDKAIVERAGMLIPEIVEKEGRPGFRDRESAEARELAGRDNLVIDTGGGIIERPENIVTLRKNATIFWLKARVETIVTRIQGGSHRPALTEGKTFTEEVAEVLERRVPMYRDSANFEIETDQLTPDQIVGIIIQIMQKRGLRLQA